MPLRPPFGEPVPHPHLAQYAGRVARVLEHDRVVGLLVVQAEAFSTKLGGVLWWRRWSAWRPAAHVLVSLPGLGVGFTDVMVDPDDLDGALGEWDAGRFRLAGQPYALAWLDEQASRRLARSEFGIDTT